MGPRATPGDIEWIDTYGHAQVCGHLVHKTQILAFEETGDRRGDGHLTAAGKQRIADALTAQLCAEAARELAAWHAAGRPVTWRTCNG